MSEDRVEIVAPDPFWASQYAEEAAALVTVLQPFGRFRLEHVGSTAIAGLRAKPIIDILLIHSTPALWVELAAPIRSLGYVYWSDNPRQDRMFFVKGMPPFGPRRTHHLHVRVPQDAEQELAFRDLLRRDSALARQYEVLKESLAARYPTDREAYTDGKTAFITEALRQGDSRCRP